MLREVRWQQIFRVHDLSEDVDSSKATATLEGHVVEIVLPKASAANGAAKKSAFSIIEEIVLQHAFQAGTSSSWTISLFITVPHFCQEP